MIKAIDKKYCIGDLVQLMPYTDSCHLIVNADEIILLKVGDNLYDKNKKICDTVTEDGNVSDGNDILSIHKMSAKHLNLTNNNGWDYYWTIDKDKGFIPINDLRYLYSESEANNE